MDQHGTASYGWRLGVVLAVALMAFGTDAGATPFPDATLPVAPQAMPQGVHIVKDTRKYTKVNTTVDPAIQAVLGIASSVASFAGTTGPKPGIDLAGGFTSVVGEVIYRADQQQLCESNVFVNDPTKAHTDPHYRGTMIVTTYTCNEKGDALGVRYIPPVNGATGRGRPASLLPMTMVYGIDKGTPTMMGDATLAGPCAEEFHFGDGGVALVTDSQRDDCSYKGRYVMLASSSFGDSDVTHWIIRVTDRVTRSGDDEKMALMVLPGKGGFAPGAKVTAAAFPDRPHSN